MDNTVKTLAKYLRKGSDNEEDVILRASHLVTNPIYLPDYGIPKYSENESDKNYLTFKLADNTQTAEFTVINGFLNDMELLFSYDGVNWSRVPKEADTIFTLTDDVKIMFKAGGDYDISYLNHIKFLNSDDVGVNDTHIIATGNFLSLVSENIKLKIQQGTTPNLHRTVFNKFYFEGFEIYSTGNSVVDNIIMGSIFYQCTFVSMSFDFDCKFDNFVSNHNGFASNIIVIFVKKYGLEKLFGNLDEISNNGTNFDTVIKIFDMDEPYILKFDRNPAFDFGILDRNIGAKSIFDTGSFFEFGKNPLKEWNIEDLYKLEYFPFDMDSDEYAENNTFLDRSNTVKYFLGPNYDFFKMSFIEGVNLAKIGGYNIIYSNDFTSTRPGYYWDPFQEGASSAETSIQVYTGILMDTFLINYSNLSRFYGILTNEYDNMLNQNVLYDFSSRGNVGDDCFNFKTIRPCLIRYETTSNIEAYERAQACITNLYL